MNAPYVSLTLTRRYVTELVRSPHAATALAPRPAPRLTSVRQGTTAPGTAPAIAGTPAPMIHQSSQRVV